MKERSKENRENNKISPEFAEFKKILCVNEPAADYKEALNHYLVRQHEKTELTDEHLDELSTALRLVFQGVKHLKDKERLSLIEDIEYTYAASEYATIQFPPISDLSKLKCFDQINVAPVKTLLVSALLRKKGAPNPRLLEEAVKNHGEITGDIEFLKNIIPDLPAAEQGFWRYYRTLQGHYSVTMHDLADAIVDYKKRLPPLPPDGIPTLDFLGSLLAFSPREYRISVASVLRGLESYDAGLADIRKTITALAKFPSDLHLFIISQNNGLTRFMHNGQLNADFFEAALDSDIAHLAYGAKDLLTPDILAALPEGKRSLWHLLQEYPVFEITDYRQAPAHMRPRLLEALQTPAGRKILQVDKAKWNWNMARTAVYRIVERPGYRQKIENALQDPAIDEFGDFLIRPLVDNPDEKNRIVSRLRSPELTALLKGYPTFTENIVNIAVSQVNLYAGKDMSDPGVKKFLHSFTGYFDSVFAIFNRQDPLPKEQVFRQLAAEICRRPGGPLISELNEIEACAKVCGQPMADFIMENADSFRYFFNDRERAGDLISYARLQIEHLGPILRSIKQRESFYPALFSITPVLTSFPVGFYEEIVRGNLGLERRERGVLLSELEACRNIQDLIADRDRMARLCTRLGTKNGALMAQSVMGLRYYEDGDDCTRRNSLCAPAGVVTEARAEGSLAERMKKQGFSASLVAKAECDRQVLLDVIGSKSLPPHVRDKGVDGIDPLWFSQKTLSRKLGPSAKEFTIYHEGRDKSRVIPAFITLWGEKVVHYFEDSVSALETDDPDTGPIVDDSLKLFNEGIELYANVTTRVVPKLEEMNAALRENLAQGIWFSGRDSVPLYLAMRAATFGLLPRPNLKVAHISRLLFDNAQSEESQGQIRNYLVRLGITHEMTAVDTGFMGSVIKKAQNLLGGVRKDRIALLESSDSAIRQILQKSNGVAVYIEELPKRVDRTMDIVNGQPFRLPFETGTVALSWVVNHAIIRHFAPRAGKEAS